MFTPLIYVCPAITVYDDGKGNYSTTVPFAECIETQRIATVDCSLAYVTHAFGQPANRWFHEFSYEISILDQTGSELPFHTQDRNIAKVYIPDQIRNLIIEVVLSSCDALIRRVRPKIIYRVTKNGAEIQKAMPKHNSVTMLLQDKGYVINETGTDAFGRMFWVMSR